MGEFDFTYEFPENFNMRIIQFLQQSGNGNLVLHFQRCRYEYEDVGLAYYAGLKGDNWDKRALDFTFEGNEEDISKLKGSNTRLKEVINKALKPNVSGFLIRNIFYFNVDISIEETRIPLSNDERLNCNIRIAESVLDDLIDIGERICLNSMYNFSCSENSINDYFRDMLCAKGYNEVKDQTRHGVSESGNNAGEVDILLTKDGKEIAIFEGLKLSSVETSYIDKHINKSIINYNALGTATFVVAYVNSENFESFCERYFKYLQKYDFPFLIKRGFRTLAFPNAVTRISNVILTKDGFDFPVYFIVLHVD